MSSPHPQPDEPKPERGLRRVLQRLTRSDAEVESAQLQEFSRACPQCLPISSAPARQQVVVRGVVRTVTVRPRNGRPALEAQLYDGTALLTLCWLGRRQIAGINPGRSLQAHGLISDAEGRLCMFNPRYELLSANELSTDSMVPAP